MDSNAPSYLDELQQLLRLASSLQKSDLPVVAVRMELVAEITYDALRLVAPFDHIEFLAERVEQT